MNNSEQEFDRLKAMKDKLSANLEHPKRFSLAPHRAQIDQFIDGKYVLYTDYADLERALHAAEKRAVEAEKERDALQHLVEWVERMVNHHGQKKRADGSLMIPPEDTLSLIQHHPGIEEITKAYSDGKIPETPNPWEQLAKLTRERDEARTRAEEGEIKGVESVTAIRCIGHRAVPIHNSKEALGGECGGCIIEELTASRSEVAALRGALEPFAKFACDPPCEGPCHNCVAKALLNPPLWGHCPTCGIEITTQNAGGYRTYCDKHAEGAALEATNRFESPTLIPVAEVLEVVEDAITTGTLITTRQKLDALLARLRTVTAARNTGEEAQG